MKVRGSSNRTGQYSSVSCHEKKRAVYVLLLFVAWATMPPSFAFQPDPAEVRYQQAVAGLDRFRSNMDGHWFGFCSRHVYSQNKTVRSRETQGVIFYSPSKIYIAYLDYAENSDLQRRLSAHTEAVISDRWVISTNHLYPTPELSLTERPDSQHLRSASPLQKMTDITLQFEENVARFITHRSANPVIDAQGNMRVRYTHGPRIFEVVFAGDSDPLPVSMRQLKELPPGKVQQLGFLNIDYGLTLTGKAIIRRITTELRHNDPNEIPETNDFRIREIRRPTWCAWPIGIGVASDETVVKQYDVQSRPMPPGTPFPSDVDELMCRQGLIPLQQHLSAQRKGLESIGEFVRAENLPITAPVAPPVRSHWGIIAATLGCGILAIVVVWIVLWKRANAVAPFTTAEGGDRPVSDSASRR